MRSQTAEYFVKTARVASGELTRGKIQAMKSRGLGIAAMEDQAKAARLTNYPNTPTTRTIKVKGADTPRVPDMKKAAALMTSLAQKFTAAKAATKLVKPKVAKLPKLKTHITSASAQKPTFARLGIK